MSVDRLNGDREILAKEENMGELAHAYALIGTDFTQARRELEGLAERGSVMAMLYLADAYKHPNNADRSEVEKWLKRAYEGGSASALLNLAKMYYRAGAVHETARLWMDGASRGDGPSMYWLSMVYHNHPDMDKESECVALLEKAAALGQLRAMLSIAKLEILGKYGIEKIPGGVLLYIKCFATSLRVAYDDSSSPRLS